MASRGNTSVQMVELRPSVADYSGASGGASSSSTGVSDGPAMDDVALDIDTLLKKVEQHLSPMETTRAPHGFLTISRVHEQTRNVQRNDYTPHYVPIGPFHWSSSSQRRIADEKFKYLADHLVAFSRRTRRNDMRVLLGELLQEMKNLDASSCYSDRFGGMGSESKFLHMLLLDGCYLLVCFADADSLNGQHGSGDGVPTTSAATSTNILAARSIMTSNDGAAEVPQVHELAEPVTTTESASGDVAENINDEAVTVRETWYLLENQIPFFVVQKIYELVTGNSPSNVLEKFKSYVKNLLYVQLYISATDPPTSDVQAPSHLLHLVHTYFTQMENSPAAQAEDGASENSPAAQAVDGASENSPAAQAEDGASENSPAAQAEGGASDSSGTGRFRRATEYCSYANMRFHPRELDSGAVRSVLDVSHDVSLADGALLLLVPLLRVDNNTWTILRNLMALEEHHAVPLQRRVTAYCLFMSQLACTEEDVALLVRSRVVQHFLGSDAEVAAGFADLCKGVVLNVDDLNSNYLKPVWHELERRYRSRWHNLLALFQQTHGRNLWYFAAFVAAVIVFAVQVLQGICTVISCNK